MERNKEQAGSIITHGRAERLTNEQTLHVIARKRNAINLEKYLFICSFLNTFNISSD